MYDKYALPYQTPTIGLWIPPKDYVRFLGNLDYYLQKEMIQITYKESNVRTLLEDRVRRGVNSQELEDLIIGRIGDIDLFFLHYPSFDAAKEKWDKRKNRIDRSNLVVKMNDQNDCSEEDMKAFLQLSYSHKLFFTAKEGWKNNPNVYYFEKYRRQGYVVSDSELRDTPFNITKYLNGLK